MREAESIRALDAPFVAAAETMDGPVAWVTAYGALAACTHSRPGRMTPNEDALALFPTVDGCVLVVADGVGGSQDAVEAARVILGRLQECLAPPHPTIDTVRSHILDGLESANQLLLGKYRDAAATVAIVAIINGRARTFHVGDCAVLVFGQRGKIKYQTVSHSPVGFAQEAGLLEEQAAIDHEDRHLISNAVGALDMRIEIGPWLTLAPYDRLLVASDGIYDNLMRDEIISATRKGSVLSSMNSLIKQCLGRMTDPAQGEPSKPDDLSAILFGPVVRR